MPEPEVTAAEVTVPAVEAETQAEAAATKETAILTRDDVKALIDETWADRENVIRKELEAAYKTLRRGEAKSDVAQQRIDKLESELFEVSVRGLEPERIEVERLKRQVQRDAETRSVISDPNAEVAAFQNWSVSVLEEERIKSDDPVLAEAFKRHADGWQNAADLRVALTRAVAAVHREREKTARSESAEREKKAREEERAKLRNETRQSEGKVDRSTPAASARSGGKGVLHMTPEEWEAFKATRGR